MATVVSQHVRHFGRHLGFFKNFILRKIAASFIEISRKHVFPASNRIRIENRKTRTNFPKNLQFSISNFNLHNWLCINYNWWRHSINVTRCAHLYQTTDTEKFHFDCLRASKFRSEKTYGGGGGGPFYHSPGCSRVNGGPNSRQLRPCTYDTAYIAVWIVTYAPNSLHLCDDLIIDVILFETTCLRG